MASKLSISIPINPKTDAASSSQTKANQEQFQSPLLSSKVIAELVSSNNDTDDDGSEASSDSHYYGKDADIQVLTLLSQPFPSSIYPSTSHLIDAVSSIRRCFGAPPLSDASSPKSAHQNPYYPLILSYQSGNMSLIDLLNQISHNIDEAYTSLDDGEAIRSAERVAASQREFLSAEEAEERYGPPLSAEELDRIAPERKLREGEDPLPSVGMHFEWLWYGLLHAAKRAAWRNLENNELSEEHTKLITLLHAIKSLLPPPLPSQPNPLPKSLVSTNPTYQSKNIYSDLLGFSLCVREMWNDSPGCGIGFTWVESEGWTNLNAFIARVTKEEIMDFALFGLWALREGLEDVHEEPAPTPVTKESDEAAGIKKEGETLEAGQQPLHFPIPTKSQTDKENMSQKQLLDAFIPAAAVWPIILGKVLYEREEDLTPKDSNQGNPAGGGERWKGPSVFSKERYSFWTERFKEIVASGSEDAGIERQTRELAREAFEGMKAISG